MIRSYSAVLFTATVFVLSSCTLFDLEDSTYRTPLEQAVYEAIFEGRHTPSSFYVSDVPPEIYVRYLGENILEDSSGRIIWIETCDASAEGARGRILRRMENLEVEVVERDHDFSHFEFDVSPSGMQPWVERVHNCSYIEKVGFATSAEGLPGIHVAGPVANDVIDLHTVQYLFDHLWHYRNYRVGGRFVLERSVRDYSDTITYEALEGVASFIDRSDDASVRVFRSVYKVDKASGHVGTSRTLETKIERLRR